MTPVALAAAVRERLLAAPAPGGAAGAEWRSLGDPPRVYGALDLAGALETLRAPCLAVVPLGEDVEPDLAPGATETVQRVRTAVAVVAVLPARNDPGGAKGAARGDGPLDLVTAAARGLLTGWRPARRWEPLALRRSRLLGLDGGRAVWQDEYTTFGWAARVRS